jgi:hypothetical protein
MLTNKTRIPLMKALVKVCPTGYDRCDRCALNADNDCKYPAFHQGALVGRRDFGTTGIEIEQQVLDAREMRKTAIQEMNRT